MRLIVQCGMVWDCRGISPFLASFNHLRLSPSRRGRQTTQRKEISTYSPLAALMYQHAACPSLASHRLLRTSVKPILPNCAFCSKRCTSQCSSLSAAPFHRVIRDWISAD